MGLHFAKAASSLEVAILSLLRRLLYLDLLEYHCLMFLIERRHLRRRVSLKLDELTKSGGHLLTANARLVANCFLCFASSAKSFLHLRSLCFALSGELLPQLAHPLVVRLEQVTRALDIVILQRVPLLHCDNRLHVLLSKLRVEAVHLYFCLACEFRLHRHVRCGHPLRVAPCFEPRAKRVTLCHRLGFQPTLKICRLAGMLLQ